MKAVKQLQDPNMLFSLLYVSVNKNGKMSLTERKNAIWMQNNSVCAGSCIDQASKIRTGEYSRELSCIRNSARQMDCCLIDLTNKEAVVQIKCRYYIKKGNPEWKSTKINQCKLGAVEFYHDDSNRAGHLRGLDLQVIQQE